MKIVLREEESGVSEVVGTILILAMTVVLFSTIILWVSTIPTPVAQTRVDILANLNPRYVVTNGKLVESGDWINMTHQGGESMPALTTVMYISDQKSNGKISTAVIHLAPKRTINGTVNYGLLDGSGLSWSVGQRFTYFAGNLSSADKITVTIVDLQRSLVLWTSLLTAPAGSRPPIFLNVYAARNNVGTPLDVQTNTAFYVFAQVMDPDGVADLNPNSVFATLTYYYGTPSCAQPLRMYDDGPSGGHGDASANDGVFTLFTNACTGNAVAGMDGSIVLFNATDNELHQTSTRMTLHVVPGPTGGNNGGGGIGGSGRPPNLRWNGNQGYNIFNATQWDTYGYAAAPTRTFKGAETVVLVVGSLTLQNVFGIDQFNLFDPFSGNPAQSVVYGATKTVGTASQPSTTSAFSFFQFVNGYYIYTYRFKLNDVSVGTNFYTTPPQYPRYYYFASYPLSVLLTDSANDRFTTTDSVNITADSGGLRVFPAIQTFSDPQFTQPAGTFRSTAIVYVQVKMLTVNLNGSYGLSGPVFFGNIMIQDFAGGQELNRAPTNGIYSNLPICPPVQACSPSYIAITSDSGTTSYRFAINLARVNQDPWVAGAQNYALTIASIKDTDESYASVSSQIVVQAPLYKMDIITGNTEGTNSAWGTKDYAYFYQDFNGFDLWKKLRVDYCYAGTSVSGVAGTGSTCPSSNSVGVAFGDFWHDGTLGVAESFYAKSGYGVELYRRAVDASGAVVYLPVFHDTPAAVCTAITTGDLTGDGLPEVVCGGANGWVWYYSNNGNWSTVIVDQPGAGQPINSISVGDFNGDGWNDIAVGGANGYLRWYPNLGYGRFQNTGITDNWFAVTESTVLGNKTAGTYLTTYTQDGIYETIKEVPLNIPLQSGTTSNAAMDNSAQGWTFAPAYNGATGQTPATGGNPNAFAQVTAPFLASQVVAGYWYQPFTVSGSPAFTVNVSLNYLLSANGASAGGGAVTFYAFVDTTAGAPPTVPSGCSSSGAGSCWSSGGITGTRGWTTLSNFAITGRVSAPGTYYLKVAMYATYLSTGSQSVGGFDNVVLGWTSQAGATSAMQQYYRMSTLPTRPGTSFTFKMTGHQSGFNSPPDFDNFTFAYSTNVVGSDPTTGTYTTMFTVNSGSDSPQYQFAMPANVSGLTVWVRVLDSNRIVGDTNMDTLFVDYMTITANTPAGTTGVTLPGPTSNVNMIDAQDANRDGTSDLVAGTTNGNVWRYMGSAGGLLAGSGVWYSTGGTPIVGVKWGNFSTAYGMLNIAVAFGTTVRIVRGDVANTVIANALPSPPSFGITAFGVGDLNGDGWDDVVIGTNGGTLILWENLGGGTSWTSAVQVDNLGTPIYSLAIGDSTNSQYMGR